MYSSVVQEQGSPLYQLFCDGTLNLVLDMCVDYWTGSTLEIIDAEVEDKIYDYYQTCIENDMQVVAFSYRPIRPGNHMRTLEMKDPDELPIYIEMPYVRSKEERNQATSSAQSFQGPSFSGDSQRLEPNSYSFDGDYRRRLSSEEGKRFFEEVVKGQTFLGMAVLSTHHPKPNVADFIEDVRLAGIRFVYFSPSPERETKAFGDRLGLETDWNSCILLSDDGEGDGYRELHDIKARLPRGIDQIRTHLYDVDDIPLHVSLFAECTPRTTVQMLKIFQEFGEIVCCIGSVLDAASTAAFAAVSHGFAFDVLRLTIHLAFSNSVTSPSEWSLCTPSPNPGVPAERCLLWHLVQLSPPSLAQSSCRPIRVCTPSPNSFARRGPFPSTPSKLLVFCSGVYWRFRRCCFFPNASCCLPFFKVIRSFGSVRFCCRLFPRHSFFLRAMWMS